MCMMSQVMFPRKWTLRGCLASGMSALGVYTYRKEGRQQNWAEGEVEQKWPIRAVLIWAKVVQPLCPFRISHRIGVLVEAAVCTWHSVSFLEGASGWRTPVSPAPGRVERTLDESGDQSPVELLLATCPQASLSLPRAPSAYPCMSG